jgi:hypothetical protein
MMRVFLPLLLLMPASAAVAQIPVYQDEPGRNLNPADLEITSCDFERGLCKWFQRKIKSN